MKVIVIGDVGAGKTACITRLTKNIYTDKYKATIGIDFSVKSVNRNGIEEKIQMWDIAGQERFNSMTTSYYRGAYGAILVYDVTNHISRDSISKWKAELDNKVTFPNTEKVAIPTILFANKIDKEHISAEELEELRAQYGFCAAVGTSAKDNIGLYEGFNTLLDAIEEMKRQHPMKYQEATIVKLQQPEVKKDGCC